MSAAKKKQPSAAATLRGGAVWLVGPGRNLLILFLFVAVIGGGWYSAHRWLWPKIAGSPEHRVRVDQVEITPPPPWIHSDIRTEVFRSPTIDGPLSNLDDDLAERIAAAFARHPWVARVQRVSKQYGGLNVELVYRKPVCVIQTAGELLPVDADGILLPDGEDFTQTEKERFPCLKNIEHPPTCPPGQRWLDNRVVGAAEIAAAIGDLWTPLRLRSIEASASDPTQTAASPLMPQSAVNQHPGGELFFTLETYSGTRIFWGHAPGANALGEPSAAKKIDYLRKVVSANDTLDGPQGPRTHDLQRLP